MNCAALQEDGSQRMKSEEQSQANELAQRNIPLMLLNVWNGWFRRLQHLQTTTQVGKRIRTPS